MRQLRHLAAPLCLAATLLAAPTAHAACADADVQPAELGAYRAAQVTACLVNAERSKRGLPKLKTNRRLVRAARRYAHTMVDNQFFDHVSPSGSTPLARIRATGYLTNANGWSIGENLAWGTGKLGTPANIVEAWMKSAGHRENILRRSFREFGMGVAIGAPVNLDNAEAGGTYATSFGSRDS